LIVDVNLVAIDASVADITVVALMGHVQVHGMAISRDIPVVVAFFLVRATAAAGSPKRAVLAIMLQRAVGENLGRLRVEPPIKQVKVVGGLMHPKRPTFLHQSVPPTKVRGPMMDIEIPVEIDRGNFADLASHQ